MSDQTRDINLVNRIRALVEPLANPKGKRYCNVAEAILKMISEDDSLKVSEW